MMEYELFVDDNYHYMDEEARYKVGTKFGSYAEALAAAKAIVDDFLESGYQPGMTSKELFQGYTGFGEDPWIVPSGEPYFSAWNYARDRCMELCRDEDAVASVPRYSAWPQELAGFRDVLVSALGRKDLGTDEREGLGTFRRAVENFPRAMPDENRWYWLRLEQGKAAYTVYLYPDRFKLSADGVLPDKVDWEVRFYGSGWLDRRVGDAAEALTYMRQAVPNPDSILKVRAAEGSRCPKIGSPCIPD